MTEKQLQPDVLHLRHSRQELKVTGMIGKQPADLLRHDGQKLEVAGMIEKLKSWFDGGWRKFRAGAALIAAAALLFAAGCTYPSEVTEFPAEAAPVEPETFDATALLAKAIEVSDTDEEAQSFWYTGYVKNNIGRRSTTSMYDGIVYRPGDAYLVNGRVATRMYQYFHFGDKSFISRGGNWFRGNPEEVLPFEPLRGFSDWLPLMDEAVKLPDSAVLSTPTHVVQVQLDAREWVERSPSELFDELRAAVGEDENLQHVLDNTIVKMTLWIAKEDAPKQANYILQYSTWLVMPLPGGGYFDQETFFRFYQHGDPAIVNQLSSPERVERYVIDAEFEQVEPSR